MKFRTTLSAAVALAIASPGFANTTDVEEVVVTATRTPVSVDKSLASVSVLTRADIARSQSESLAELLSGLAGVETTVSGSRGATTTLNVRGGESDHVLVIVDGVRMSSATNGSTALSQIPLSQIERVELVRGPRASLYGSDAVGGVLQIFTRKGTESIAPYAEVEVGSFDRTKVNAGVSGKVEGTSFSLSAAHEELDGFDSSVTVPGSPNNDDDSYLENSFSASLTQELTENWAIEANALYVDSELETDEGSLDDESHNINQSFAVSLKGALTDSLGLTVAVNEAKDESESFGSNPSHFDTQRSGALLQLDYSLTDSSLISVGYDYFDDEVESSNSYSQYERYNRAHFVQYQYAGDVFSFNGSYRQDDNESFGKNDTGSVSFGYQLTDDVLVSISHGTAFKAPTFNDLYFPVVEFAGWWAVGSIYRYGGNTELQPEESETTELMIRGDFESFDWSFSYFETRTENLIELDEVQVTPLLTVSGPFNVSEALIRGSELTLETALMGWNARLAMSYIDPRNQETDDVLADRSRGNIDISLDKAWGDFSYALQWHAQSERYNYDVNAGEDRKLGGFNTVAMKASYRLSSDLSVAVKVDNLFDNDYQLRHSFRTPGRTASLSFRYGF